VTRRDGVALPLDLRSTCVDRAPEGYVWYMQPPHGRGSRTKKRAPPSGATAASKWPPTASRARGRAARSRRRATAVARVGCGGLGWGEVSVDRRRCTALGGALLGPSGADCWLLSAGCCALCDCWLPQPLTLGWHLCQPFKRLKSTSTGQQSWQELEACQAGYMTECEAAAQAKCEQHAESFCTLVVERDRAG